VLLCPACRIVRVAAELVKTARETVAGARRVLKRRGIRRKVAHQAPEPLLCLRPMAVKP
jgi:hypothetical protein